MNRIFLNEDLSLNYSFLTDAILSRYFRDLEIYYFEKCTDENGGLCMMKDKIRKRLADKLEKHKNDNIMLVKIMATIRRTFIVSGMFCGLSINRSILALATLAFFTTKICISDC